MIKREAGRQGGVARKEALSDERRREIARTARVGKVGRTGDDTGNFKDEFGIDVDCYVLNDHMKTAVISQRGMGQHSGSALGGRRISEIHQRQIDLAIPWSRITGRSASSLLNFKGRRRSLDSPSNKIIHGFDVTLLIDVCKAIVAAESDGKLTPNQTGIAEQAHLILSASAKSGIKGLVYALAGYDATRQQVIDAFKLYVREEAEIRKGVQTSYT